MSDQSRTNRARETAKLAIRKTLQRADLEIGRGSYAGRLVRTLESRGIDTVLDIGANVGQYATLTRSAGFGGRIISCEPLSGAFAELGKRAARDDAWTVLNVAVGAEPGEAVINVSANSFSSSIRGMTDTHLTTAPGSQYIASETVPVTTVAEIAATHAVEPARTLLKIDTQGFEGEVLQGAGGLVGQVAAIQLELSFVELYDDQLLFDDLVGSMTAHGYRIQQIEPGYSGPDGRMMQVDGLFVRLADDA
ncbi:FkbM family methyltransferase [Aeromicrobium fastidiosum]|uniref:FkbM family methyltransferase n=1 Tax=Aeromicrobium fastidiosum TaxID=52699 RepID=A0A641AS27_9ACTN|nr:FkbM family methyltransferase [Aeromicrobium fastidiosum]KAA1380759.1 FkbM family methyltransferase [Aeromicrobium fastidiosum]MBP2390378.1 FkbM family methyltransferase [Aeromicrobium fastidiosum]